MTHSIDIIIEEKKWGSKKNWQPLFAKTFQAISSCLKIKRLQKASVAVLLTNDSAIQNLNAHWRKKDKPTNVLSFPATENQAPFLGDIAFALQTIKREALEENKSFENHVQHLLVHGILHLLGYDHEQNDDAEEMEALEIQILSNLGIPNPYTML